jgi:hypothetical protein
VKHHCLKKRKRLNGTFKMFFENLRSRFVFLANHLLQFFLVDDRDCRATFLVILTFALFFDVD